jgi:peptide/nickel transport system ATP-binding protein
MYAGRIAETGPVHELIHHPAHPYTAGLMASIPDMESDRERLSQIDGAMPRLDAIPTGCSYNPRCARSFSRCTTDVPPLMPAGATQASCWLHAQHAVAAA